MIVDSNDDQAIGDVNSDRLVDEQYVEGQPIDPFCGNGGEPVTEWGEDWNPNSPVPPFYAVIDIQSLQDIEMVALYDGFSESGPNDIFKVEYGEWDGTTFTFQGNVIPDHAVTPIGWEVFNANSNLPLVRYIRVWKMTNEAAVNEISLCTNQALRPPGGRSAGQEGEQEINNAFSGLPLIYPNPTRSEITVVLPPGEYRRLLLSDMNGRAIKSDIIGERQSEKIISVSDLPAGIYFLHLENMDGSIHHVRFVKMN